MAVERRSSPIRTPKSSVKRADVEERMVVLATLVMEREALERYCDGGREEEGGERRKEG